MRTRDRVTSACQRWWLWTTVTGDVVTQGQSSQGRRGAGVHGSTPYRRLATSAVSVALAKAAQAGFPRRGGRARASLGAALDAGRPWSDLVTNHIVRTVSKVLCLRSLRTSRCCWAYSFQTASRLFRLTQTRISRCLAKAAAARAAPLVLSRPPQLRRVPAQR